MHAIVRGERLYKVSHNPDSACITDKIFRSQLANQKYITIDPMQCLCRTDIDNCARKIFMFML